ncbi:hypothetical protein L198_02415 [Cryptococcus wingfieldii CBS 7118]|uniref:Uncharacterized protein n=1 Tax=Cryptococcus wingfieldii CBS 7118 TaxID=1295528 RepID=A0A1E3JTW6_9TREE|nr:hypothetical protein L198_02415 [Cryptococcus wingfieldii CBS 7118]ODO03567.1 hypothetical protein L198_02415 [Cryptococcus wingfieldii CBS 7118]
MPNIPTTLSMTSSLGAAPRALSNIPSLGELQKQAESLGSSISSNLPSLPAYSSPPESPQRLGQVANTGRPNVGKFPGAPPSYSEADPRVMPGRQEGGNKLKKAFPGWIRLPQVGIPGEMVVRKDLTEGGRGRPVMKETRVYAESVRSSNSVSQNNRPPQPSFLDW